jgi:signal transduction histidine kinase
MKNLMEDVLFMGRAEAVELECKPVLLNLEQFCRELIEEFSATENSSQKIIFTCDSHHTDAVMDEQLLHYLFGNLLSNAVKYSFPGGEIQFHLTCDSVAGVATFEIQDQGIGIPEADKARLFESFYRASNVQSIQGTGLGLVVVKRCVDAHKGEIKMTSQVGVGTTFTIILPLNLA